LGSAVVSDAPAGVPPGDPVKILPAGAGRFSGARPPHYLRLSSESRYNPGKSEPIRLMKKSSMQAKIKANPG